MRHAPHTEKGPRPLLEGACGRLPIPDLLQSLVNGSPCQVLFVLGHEARGFVWMDGRKVVRCHTRRARGRAAFFELMEMPRAGGFRVFPLPPERVPVLESVALLEELLLQAVYLSDAEAMGGQALEDARRKLGLKIEHNEDTLPSLVPIRFLVLGGEEENAV